MNVRRRDRLADRDLGGLVDVLLADGESDEAWQVVLENPEWEPRRTAVDALAEAREPFVPGDAFEIYLRLADLELRDAGRPAYTRAVAILRKAARAAKADDREDEFTEHVAIFTTAIGGVPRSSRSSTKQSSPELAPDWG